MSTHYRPMKTISFAELFDGRLERYGVREHVKSEDMSDRKRCLTDGRYSLWVYAEDDGTVSTMLRAGMLNAPGRILGAVAETFDTEIFSEYEAQFWGFDTQAEWDAWMDKLAEEDNAEFYTDIINFVSGEPHNFKSDTVGMNKANIAKDLVAENPEFLTPERKSELMEAIEEIYLDKHEVCITLALCLQR